MDKSIIDIDVNDEKWKKFIETYKEYQESAARLDEVWKKFDVSTAKPRAAMEALNKSMGGALKSSTEMHKTWTALGKAIGDSESKMTRFGRAIKGVETGLRKVAHFGIQIGKFALAAGGIGMFGGLFGLDELANSALRRQRSARGLGMSIGQVSAFDTYMTPYLQNPHAVLQSIISARQSPAGQAALISLGFSPAQYRHPANRMAFAGQVIERFRKLYLEHKAAGNEALWLQAYGMRNLGLGETEGRLLSNTPNLELATALRNAQRAAPGLNVPGTFATNWASLSVQLHRAGIEIETALTNKLVKLAPLIGELSQKVVGLINRFLNSKDITAFLGAFEGKLKEFVTFLGSRELRRVFDHVGNAAMRAAYGLSEIGKVFGGPAFKALFKTLGYAWHAENFLEKKYAALGHYLFGPAPGKTGTYKNPADWRAHNDPGNIDPIIGGKQLYRSFPSMAAGYRAIADTLLGYHVNTVRALVTKYEGAHAPDLRQHIATIARWMHVKPGERIDLDKRSTLANLTTGIAEFENRHRQDRHQLYQTIRDAIIEGINASRVGNDSGRTVLATHAGKY